MADKSPSKKITVDIILFPPFSNSVSNASTRVVVEENSTVKELLRVLSSNDSHIKRHLGDSLKEEDIRLRALIIHNDHMARLDQEVKEGDCFKLLHPLQGG